MPDQNTLKDEILSMLKNETKDLWKKQNTAFLDKLATQMASEQFKALAEADSQKKQEHIDNLKDLKAQLNGEIAIYSMDLNQKGNEIIERLISITIETVISIIKAKLA